MLLARHTWQCISAIPEATNRARMRRKPLKVTVSVKKSPSRVRDQEKRVAGRYEREQHPSWWVVINLHSRQIVDFERRVVNWRKIDLEVRPAYDAVCGTRGAALCHWTPTPSPTRRVDWVPLPIAALQLRGAHKVVSLFTEWNRSYKPCYSLVWFEEIWSNC